MRKIISVVLLLALMSFIFYLSAQSADLSGNSSHTVTRFIAKIYISDFEEKSTSEQEEIINSVDNYVRTAAHFSEYAALGFLALNCAFAFEKLKYKKTVSIIFGILYAVSDEIHQFFVPGRACQLSDITVDSLGCILGVFVYFVAFLLVCRLFKKSKKTDAS